jgi:hypothetical protein
MTILGQSLSEPASGEGRSDAISARMRVVGFLRWVDRQTRKESPIPVILLNCVFAMGSILFNHGGILNPEMEIRLPYFLSEKPLLNKLFDSRILDADMFQARELSYLVDYFDSKFIEFSIHAGFPHFLSMSYYLFSIAIGCMLWYFVVKELKLHPAIGLGLVALLWTSPSFFIGGSIFRSSKIGVSLLASILYIVLYRIAAFSIQGRDINIRRTDWLLFSLALFLLPFLDQQGLFLSLAVLIFLAVWILFLRQKNKIKMLLIGVTGLTLYMLYRYLLAPQLTFSLNGYWPNFDYQNLPIKHFIKYFPKYLNMGFALYIDTFRYLTGNLPRAVGIGLLIVIIASTVYILKRKPELVGKDQKVLRTVVTEVLLINVLLIIVMFALMVLRHEPLMWPDVSRVYYWMPAVVMLVMSISLLLRAFYSVRIPNWVLLLVMALAIAGNIVALPGHKAILEQGALMDYYGSSADLLNALKNKNSTDSIYESSIIGNPVYQYFESKEH